MKEKKYNFCYVTTNIVNGKQYIGDHSTNDLNCVKTKNYIGSGRPYFEKAKKKYGKENFKREILEFFDTKQEAFIAQEKWINEYDTLVPNGYNLSPTGGIGANGHFHPNKKLSKEHKEKISEALLGRKLSKEHKKNLLGKNIGKKHSLEQNKAHSRAMSGEGNPNYRKRLNEEHKEKIRQGNLGKIVSKETREKQKQAKLGKSSPLKGRKLSEEHKAKLRKSKSKNI